MAAARATATGRAEVANVEVASAAAASVVEVARRSAADRAGVGSAVAVPRAGPLRWGDALTPGVPLSRRSFGVADWAALTVAGGCFFPVEEQAEVDTATRLRTRAILRPIFTGASSRYWCSADAVRSSLSCE